MDERWFKEAVIYCLDVDTFQDSDGDGTGDLRGLTARLDHIARLGATCVWLNPVHPTPNRDDGYDVSDFYAVDPRLGTLGDFVELVHQAGNRGLRIIIDLVVNHTSDQHPWFQSARSSPDSPYRDWYVWSPVRPAFASEGVVFPGVQEETWTYDEAADAWYHHRFYDFQPDLNWANPAVRDEVKRICAFWLQLGVDGFRMDAAPFVIEDTHADQADARRAYEWLGDLREHLRWRKGDSVVLAEANVPKDEILQYFGAGDRLPMLFGFALNQRLFLSLASGLAAPVNAGIEALPVIPATCAWASFLRNHDEVDLSALSDRERALVFDRFGPEPEMQLYGRGIRRRLAPMLGGERRHLELAYALQCTLPGTPVIRYGEEIGMGDDLSLPERDALRTPMQWSAVAGGGFSTAPRDQLRRPVIDAGPYGYEHVNVTDQRRDPASLLTWFERLVRALRDNPELGVGSTVPIDAGDDHVIALLHDAPGGTVVSLANLVDEPRTVTLGQQPGTEHDPLEMFADRAYPSVGPDLAGLELAGWGYRWLRLRRSIGR